MRGQAPENMKSESEDMIVKLRRQQVSGVGFKGILDCGGQGRRTLFDLLGKTGLINIT